MGPVGLNFAYLSLCWAILVSSWALLGPSRGLLEPSWGHLGARLGPLGAILGPSWALLGPSWALLGPPWDHPTGLLGLLGVILGPHRGSLGPSWGHLGSWRSRLGSPWGSLGTLVDHLGAILGQHAPILGQLGHLRSYLRAFWLASWAIWNPFRVALGSSWGHVWGILCYIGRVLLCCLDLPFYLSFSCLPIHQQTPSLEDSDPRGASAGTRSAYNMLSNMDSINIVSA